MCPEVLVCVAHRLEHTKFIWVNDIDSRDVAGLAKGLASDFTHRHRPEDRFYWADRDKKEALDAYLGEAVDRLEVLGEEFLLDELPYCPELRAMVYPAEVHDA